MKNIIIALLILGSTALAADKPKELKPEDLTDVKVGASVTVLTKLGLKPVGKSNRYAFGGPANNGAYVEKGKVVSIQYEPFVGMAEDDLLRLNQRGIVNGHAVDPPKCDWKLTDESTSRKVYEKEVLVSSGGLPSNMEKHTQQCVVTDGKVSRIAK